MRLDDHFFRVITRKCSNDRFFREINSFFRNNNVIICKCVNLTHFSWIRRIIALSTEWHQNLASISSLGKKIYANFWCHPARECIRFWHQFSVALTNFSWELPLWIEILRYFDEIFCDVMKSYICIMYVSNL